MSSESILTKMELLKIARELVINEYIDRRAQDHNAWLANSDASWRANRSKLPYPPFPPYPSETDIITRANILNEFLNAEPAQPVTKTQSTAALVADPIIPPSVEVLPEPVIVAADDTPLLEVESVFPVILEQMLTDSPPQAAAVDSASDLHIPEFQEAPAVILESTVVDQTVEIARILKIFGETAMPPSIMPIESILPQPMLESSAILNIFKPATDEVAESNISPAANTLSSIAAAVVDTAAARTPDTNNIVESHTTFSSLLPNWLLKK